MKCFYFQNNHNYGLFCDAVLSWDETDTKTGEIVSPVPMNIVAVLNSVKTAFEKYFGCEYMNNLRAYVLPCGESPTSFWQTNLIGLTARGRRWSRYSYQFAHELCHLTIAGDVIQSLRWFEESICELASVFFMQEMANMWTANPPYENWKDYAPSLSQYANNEISKSFQIPNGVSFSQFFCDKSDFLSINPYERDINCLCAKNLLPIFSETPSLWQDIPAISNLKQEVDFFSALSQWKEEAKAKDAIEKIINLFYPA